jgi:superfamily II DNA or RNA helicase
LRLFCEKVLVSREGKEEELELPVLGLSFDYGGTLVSATDERRRFFIAEGASLTSVERDIEFEAQANQTLERLGAVELGCLPGYEAQFDSAANYVVAVDADVHTYCSFTAHALPQLRAAGFRVEIDPDYPYQVLDGALRWYVGVEPIAERSDWFSCELGVELGGARMNLLGALLDLLDSMPDSSSLSLLSALKFVALPVDEHHYVPVPKDVMVSLLDVLRELYGARSAQGERLELCRAQAGSIADLADALGSETRRCVWHAPESFRRGAGVRDLGDPRSLPTAPPVLDVTLRPYQTIGVAWLQRLSELEMGGVLADDMGLGKTLQTITHLALEHVPGRATAPSLIVAPTSLVRHWARELNRFAPKLTVVVWHGNTRRGAESALSSADVVITSYGLIAREPEAWAARRFHLVVLDEAQAIKNPRAAARRALCGLDARLRLCLSGTPVENHLGDLWSLFDFVLPGLLGDAASFQEHYRTPIEQANDDKQLAALRRTVAPFILRRTKEEVANDLPPKTQIVRPVVLSGRQRQLYESIRIAAHEDVRSAIRRKGLTGSALAILDALMKLRQVCCDPRLVRVSAAREVTESAKLDHFFALLEQQLEQGRAVLVFSQFTSMLGIIAQGLVERQIEYLLLTGATQDRQAKVDAFQRGFADVFLISLKAGGTGLNLTRADTVIHYDPWWNPTAQAQATDRAHRIGQKRPVFAYQLITLGSVEERMLELQQRKFALAQGIIGPADRSPSLLTEQDVSSLFSPLED